MKKLFFLGIAMSMLVTVSVVADVPQLINYQGHVSDAEGTPLDTTVAMTFAIYNDPSDGSSIWSETQGAVNIVTGQFSVQLGSVVPLDDSVFSSTDCYLGVSIGTDPEIEPRTRLTAVPYSQRVSTVDGTTGGTIAGSLTITTGTKGKEDIAGDLNVAGKATIGPGCANTGDHAFVAGYNNTASGVYSTIGGGYNNAASDNYSTVGGGTWDTASGDHSTVGGGLINIASGSRSTVGGGQDNIASGTRSTVGGGTTNAASHHQSTVGGGGHNTASGFYSTVGGGADNTASGDYSMTGGGTDNTASGYISAVLGGYRNSASGYWALAVGGESDSAKGKYSTVVGGYINLAGDDLLDSCAFVGGGGQNQALSKYSTIGGGQGNTASGEHSVVGGGLNNEASGMGSTIGGGVGNQATSMYATVPGGYACGALGAYSFAAGHRASAWNDGSFVWADASSMDFFISTTNNEFKARTSGGVRFYTNSTLTTGVYVSAGGSGWSSVCDSSVKENIRPVDGEAILEKLSELPISQWNYKTQDESIQHIGPMAQDLYKLFNLGEDDKHINTLDPDGIALAAIQALYKKTQRIENLETEVAELKALVAQLVDQNR